MSDIPETMTLVNNLFTMKMWVLCTCYFDGVVSSIICTLWSILSFSEMNLLLFLSVIVI